MDDLSEQLKKLGESVSETGERLTDPGELTAARRLWLQAPERTSAARARWPLALAAAAGAAALILALIVWRPSARVSFVVGSPPAHGAVGDWVAADASAPLPMRFSEGTSFTLASGARARVTETTARGATVLLERGDVAAAVQHLGADTRWNLQAGPFVVRVTGTKFDASWDPTGETFALAMTEGTVVVQGPLLQSGRELRAGEHLRVSVRDGSMEVHTAPLTAAAVSPPVTAVFAAPALPAASSAEPLPVAAMAPPSSSVLPAPSASAASTAAREPSWHDLAVAGKYNEALAAAERAGFAQEIDRASSQDLAALADAARFAARPALARQALLAQRRRFGVRGSSAFVLGKIAVDQQGAAADAVRWFETYLREEPNGALAEQAMGRILELKKGDPAGARATAERYLTRYPRGAHAALARSLLAP
jgi:hypothetical protein